MWNNDISAKDLMHSIEQNLSVQFHCTIEDASAQNLHMAIGHAVIELVTPAWLQCEKACNNHKQACYLSAEYLMGRMVYSNLFNLGVLDDLNELFKMRGLSLQVLETIEDDAFGNGGLGRLAACFLDSAATLSLPLQGYGLRYKYGLFHQSIINGRQIEQPDDWSKYGDPWSIRRYDEAVVVPMKTGTILAVPYDMPIIGYKSQTVATLRLWQCESLTPVDYALFSQQKYAKAEADKRNAEVITMFLYPNDNNSEGKKMRIQQQYVLVSASMQDMFRKYEARHGNDWSHFHKEFAVQLNDTHPVMAIPEMIRLLKARGMHFRDALELARSTFSYTNHTIMQEALEKWDLKLLSLVVPDIVQIIQEIDLHCIAELHEHALRPTPQCCIIYDRQVHMAQLAVYATHVTNGVAEIHSDLLRKDLFREWYALYPERFQNKTNGITPRRWLGLCNSELTELIQSYIGDGFLTDLNRLSLLKQHIDETLISRFRQVKQIKKQQLCSIIFDLTGEHVSPEMCFDVQVKRLHEYKRQLMNAFSILAIWHGIKENRIAPIPPTAFIFGAKAASGYTRAKSIIYFINKIAEIVNHDETTQKYMRVIFLPNYNCSLAESIIPAADISEQISPAGTEASGTGNMKLMLNGAVTLGTYDGANIEIVQEAGRENNYIFGATVEELNSLKSTYNPKDIYENDPIIHQVVDDLVNGLIPDPDGGLAELYSSILNGASWHQPDHYYILQDFPSYLETKLKAINDYSQQPTVFAKKCLENIASSGKFSSDRTVQQYADEVWEIKPISV